MSPEELQRFENGLRERGWRWNPSSEPLMETDVKLYESREKANEVGARLAFGWLLRNSDVTGIA